MSRKSRKLRKNEAITKFIENKISGGSKTLDLIAKVLPNFQATYDNIITPFKNKKNQLGIYDYPRFAITYFDDFHYTNRSYDDINAYKNMLEDYKNILKQDIDIKLAEYNQILNSQKELYMHDHKIKSELELKQLEMSTRKWERIWDDIKKLLSTFTSTIYSWTENSFTVGTDMFRRAAKVIIGGLIFIFIILLIVGVVISINKQSEINEANLKSISENRNNVDNLRKLDSFESDQQPFKILYDLFFGDFNIFNSISSININPYKNALLRTEYTEGRWDNIKHFETLEGTDIIPIDKDNIYSIIQPNDILVSIDQPKDNNMDFKQLPTDIKNLLLKMGNLKFKWEESNNKEDMYRYKLNCNPYYTDSNNNELQLENIFIEDTETKNSNKCVFIKEKFTENTNICDEPSESDRKKPYFYKDPTKRYKHSVKVDDFVSCK